ncbi:unnamed protein product [marine sediment metagenome]|uniref:Uncharacterized protein n=1 Tax=marine sediment metagenome TaxID=412755 RepID=X1GB85_9ZZZZ
MTQVERNFYVNRAPTAHRTIFEFRRDVRNTVLNTLFRDYSFFTPDQKLRKLPIIELRAIAGVTRIPVKIVDAVVCKILADLGHSREFYKTNSVSYTPFSHLRKMKIYLHKFNRLAPVFNFQRAKHNARILEKKLNHLCFWPKFMTQIAIVIYVTDLKDPQVEKPIKQTNIRALCGCSAYAFHRTRNKLGLK